MARSVTGCPGVAVLFQPPQVSARVESIGRKIGVVLLVAASEEAVPLVTLFVLLQPVPPKKMPGEKLC